MQLLRSTKKKVRSYKERKNYAKITVTLVLLHSNGDTRCLYPLKKNNSGYIYEFIWLRDAYPLRLRTLTREIGYQ